MIKCLDFYELKIKEKNSKEWEFFHFIDRFERNE